MEAWKRCILVVKIVILVIGYPGILINIESNHIRYNEMQEIDPGADERFAMDSNLSNPDSINTILKNLKEKGTLDVFNKDKERVLQITEPEFYMEIETGRESYEDADKRQNAAEMGQKPVESDSNRQNPLTNTEHLQQATEPGENGESTEPDKNDRHIESNGDPGEPLGSDEDRDEPIRIDRNRNKTGESGNLEELSEKTESGSESDPVFAAEVKAIVEKSLKQYPLEHAFGLYIKELKTGYEFGINEDLTYYDENDGNTDGYFRAASVVKLQMAYAAYRLMEKGELDPETAWIDPVTKQELSILPTLHKMVSRSDNNLFNCMLRLLGREKVNKTLDEYGIVNSNIYGEINPSIGYSSKNNLERHGTTKTGGKITPREMGIILEAVYNERETNKFMGMLNEALLANIYNSRIPKGINNKYPVAHKTGTSDDAGVYNDAGIIYGETPYILVVLTKGESSSRAQGFIRLLSKEMTDYMDSRK